MCSETRRRSKHPAGSPSAPSRGRYPDYARYWLVTADPAGSGIEDPASERSGKPWTCFTDSPAGKPRPASPGRQAPGRQGPGRRVPSRQVPGRKVLGQRDAGRGALSRRAPGRWVIRSAGCASGSFGTKPMLGRVVVRQPSIPRIDSSQPAPASNRRTSPTEGAGESLAVGRP